MQAFVRFWYFRGQALVTRDKSLILRKQWLIVVSIRFPLATSNRGTLLQRNERPRQSFFPQNGISRNGKRLQRRARQISSCFLPTVAYLTPGRERWKLARSHTEAAADWPLLSPIFLETIDRICSESFIGGQRFWLITSHWRYVHLPEHCYQWTILWRQHEEYRGFYPKIRSPYKRLVQRSVL